MQDVEMDARRRSAVTSICHNSAQSSHMSTTFQTDYFGQGGPQAGVENLLAMPPKQVNYMLFVKPPNPGDDKKLKADKVEIMAMKSEEE